MASRYDPRPVRTPVLIASVALTVPAIVQPCFAEKTQRGVGKEALGASITYVGDSIRAAFVSATAVQVKRAGAEVR
jgi:hypothetical protein